ncbi:trp operon repressor [Candidatus Nomurabacteria bacterium]|nr:trp operon repressor [Candidatus Nomurabacteria bacterium]
MYSSKELVSLLCKITEPKEMELFLTDLLTSSEQKELSQRLQIVKLLHKNVPQRTIAEKLGIGVATITRGSKEMQKKNSGFQKILDKYYDR